MRFIFLYFFSVLLLIPSAGCEQTSRQPASLNAIRIMPLGDSITHAERGHDSYRYWLWKYIRAEGYNVDFVGSNYGVYWGWPHWKDFDQNHEGHWGWRADEILEYLPKWAEREKPDIVLIHLGTNDILSGESPESTVEELGRIIDVLRASNPNVKIALAQLIPTTRPVPGLTKLNNLIPALADAKSTDLSPIVVVNQHRDINPREDLYDGLHPNEKGEKKIAKRWFQDLQPWLDEPLND